MFLAGLFERWTLAPAVAGVTFFRWSDGFTSTGGCKNHRFSSLQPLQLSPPETPNASSRLAYK
jgi:hypothetical protein